MGRKKKTDLVHLDKAIIFAVSSLKAHNYNYREVSDTLGIPVRKLYTWLSEHGRTILGKDYNPSIVETMRHRIYDKKESFDGQIWDMKLQIMDKLKSLIETEENLAKLTLLLERIHNISKESLPQEIAATQVLGALNGKKMLVPEGTSTVNYYQNIINQMVIKAESAHGNPEN